MHWFKKFYRALTRREKMYFSAAAAAAVIGVSGFGLAFFINHTVSVPAVGGTYREAMLGQPAYVNPVTAKSATDKSLSTLLFATIPDLADHIETATDGKSVRVHLKDNLHWSDGAEITSDDIIFTVDMIQNPDADSPLLAAWQGVRADRVSKLEVNFTLPGPYVFFNETLANLRPIPKHIFASIPPANWRLSEYNLRPVASGPYIFVSRAVGTDGFVSAYNLKANQRFAGQSPFIANFEISFAHDHDDLLKQFNTGQADGIFLSDATDAQNIRRPYQNAEFKSPAYYAVFWNQSANSALTSSDVRTALDMAVDKNELEKAVLGAAGNVSTDPLSPAFFSPLQTTSSIDAANALLDKAGWTRGDDGLRVKKNKKNSTNLSFTLLVPDVPFLQKSAEILKTDWGKVGARVSVNVLPLDQILAGPIKNRTYEAVLFGNTPTAEGDLFSFWHSSERLYPGLNLALYQSKSADQLIEKIRLEPDMNKRRVEMDELRQKIAADEPAVFLFSPATLYATGKNLQGLTPDLITEPANRFQNVSKWYIQTKRVSKK